MDEAFLLRARRLLDERRPNLDHRGLLEHISSQAAATPTACANAAVNQITSNADEFARISSLIVGEAEWRQAANRQGGCFNRAVAARRVNEA